MTRRAAATSSPGSGVTVPAHPGPQTDRVADLGSRRQPPIYSGRLPPCPPWRLLIRHQAILANSRGAALRSPHYEPHLQILSFRFGAPFSTRPCARAFPTSYFEFDATFAEHHAKVAVFPCLRAGARVLLVCYQAWVGVSPCPWTVGLRLLTC